MLTSKTDYRNTGRRGRRGEMTAEWTTLAQHRTHILTDLIHPLKPENELTFKVESLLFGRTSPNLIWSTDQGVSLVLFPGLTQC